MSKFVESLELIGLYFVVKFRNFVEWVKVVCLYYFHRSFFKVHLFFVWLYLGLNPYRVSKYFLMQRGVDDLYTYGETPLTSFHKIVKEIGVTADDVFFELGCGRGLGVFWLNNYIGCKVVGVEYIDVFVDQGQKIAQRLQLNDVIFRCEDILTTDLSGATVLYFYGTGFDDNFINKFVDKVVSLPSGTKIITVSYPLTDYTDKCKVTKQFDVSFTWGSATVYLQVV